MVAKEGKNQKIAIIKCNVMQFKIYLLCNLCNQSSDIDDIAIDISVDIDIDTDKDINIDIDVDIDM